MASPQAQITFVTGGSGGVGKSAAARMLANALGEAGYRTLLVDGNPGQQSQRAFLHAPDTKALEYALVDGAQAALMGPKRTGGRFAFLAGPADPHSPTCNEDYIETIIALRAMCRFIVVDTDRIDGRVWDDPHAFAGQVMRPFVEQAGARLLFRIGQEGSQTDDGLAALETIGRPDSVMAVGVAARGATPRPAGEWKRLIEGMAQWGGVDRWTAASAQLIDEGRSGWPRGREPDWLRRAAVWAGADKGRFRRGAAEKDSKGGFRWPWTR
ncbi:nucleotide-binding protein [Bifidobacterium myosotis]|uniref:CobQ/CobB/MinD/ParA nucleotide binding domain-containing protein n=1 Tax=Bifidobacterium myosotis TaxID=1630166 RepID=A0A5M9ZHA6_9BIFI|nr:hypothetical protein [Bifidobacterium myosotis]KAA8827001.1 hypothetical protein EMO91_10765 [Bifidobacterium myosotis]